jgi:hypothetical protein
MEQKWLVLTILSSACLAPLMLAGTASNESPARLSSRLDESRRCKQRLCFYPKSFID